MGELFGGVETINLPDAELFYWPTLFPAADASNFFSALVDGIAWRQDDILIAGKTIPVPRLNAWYGDDKAVYTYSGIRFESLPWTRVLMQLRDTVAKRIDVDAGKPVIFNSVLANYYRDEQDSVAWHADDEPELGTNPLIASLSLGATRRFCLRHNTLKTRVELPLSNGSLLLMAGTTQHHWQHQVPKERAVTEGRVNLTFRHVGLTVAQQHP